MARTHGHGNPDWTRDGTILALVVTPFNVCRKNVNRCRQRKSGSHGFPRRLNGTLPEVKCSQFRPPSIREPGSPYTRSCRQCDFRGMTESCAALQRGLVVQDQHRMLPRQRSSVFIA